MKLKKFYENVIKEGVKQDPREKKIIDDILKSEKKKYEKLDKKDKDYFDKDRLFNPFADTRVLYGDLNTEIKTAIIGIDMEVAELVLVDRLKEKGKRIDLVISHHPDGFALANFHEVMSLQTNVFYKQGVPIGIAENLTKTRMAEVGRNVSAANHMQTVDAARLLDIPFMCMHTPADNHVYSYLQNIFDKKRPEKLKDILDILNSEPEYKEARKNNAAPFVLNGSPESLAGNIMVDMTGGTEGSRDIFARLAQNGVSTIVCMHFSEAHFKKAKAENINVINAGHIASDNLGINLLLDAVLKNEKISIMQTSGFRRYKRK